MTRGPFERPRLWRPPLLVPRRRNLVGAARAAMMGAAGRAAGGGANVISFGTIQTPTVISPDANNASFMGLTVDEGANKALAIVQFVPAFNQTADFSTATATLNGSAMTKALHSLETEGNYRYGRATFWWIDNPEAGTLALTFDDPDSASDVVAGVALTFVPIFNAPAGAGAFGATARSAIGTTSTAMPLTLQTTAPNSWIFSALTRRDDTDGPFAFDDTDLMSELFEWAGPGTNDGCGLTGYGQASAADEYDVGGDATNASGGTNQLSTVAAIELLQPS